MSDPTAPSTPGPSTALAVRFEGVKLDRAGMDALRRGDRAGLLRSFGIVLADAPESLRAGLERVAELAMELRRSSVAVLGNSEAFVRRTASGSLSQVLMPVTLKLADKTLFQIPKRTPLDPDGNPVGNIDKWKAANPNKRIQWKDVPQKAADVTYPGLLRINGVAGCAVGQPPSVMVDGEPRTNPYVERTVRADAQLGDIRRVVIAVIVVGPAPATGNPVVVNYTLDYDPAKDLHHMLAEVSSKHPDECILSDEQEVRDAERKPGWKFTPIYGGVGYHYNLRCDEIAGVYADFINLLQNAVKKAQTVARRNAMKAHPATAFHTVEVDSAGRAVVPVIGWASNDAAMVRWQEMCERLARGLPLPETADVEVISVESKYDAKKDVTGDRSIDPTVSATGDDGAGPEDTFDEHERLIEQIDRGIAMLKDPARVARLNYEPDRMNDEQLAHCLETLNQMLDEQA